MKKIFTLVILCLLALTSVCAQIPAEVFAQANKAYAAEQYQDALNGYLSLVDQGLESADLYYNLGNAYYRTGELALAILYYERASKLRPGDKEIAENIAFCYSRTEDKIDAMPSFFLVRWWQSLVGVFSPRGWMWLLIAVSVVLVVLGTCFLLAHEYTWRKNSLMAAVATLVVWLVVLVATVNASYRVNHSRTAIVTAPLSVVKSSPNESSVDKFVLHEGTKVRMLDDMDQWVKISIADGNKGWLPVSDITMI